MSKAQAAIGVVFGIGPKASAYTAATITGATASTTSGSTALSTVTSTTGMAIGMPISGTGIPAGTVITAIGSGTLTLSKKATATGATIAITVNVFIPIGEMADASVTGNKWQTEDTTSFDSGNTMESLKTIKDPGNVPLKGNRVSDDYGQIALKAAFEDSVAYMFQEQFPVDVDQTVSGDTVVYQGLVDQFDDTVAVGKVIKIAANIKRTGTPTFTAGS